MLSTKLQPLVSHARKSQGLATVLLKSCSNEAAANTIKKPTGPLRPIGAGGYFLLIVPVSTFCLGTWQVKRRKWKLARIEQMERQLKESAIPIPENLEDLKGMEYRRVILKGKFEHDKEMYVIPRQLKNKDESAKTGGLMTTSCPKGGHVVTPFKLTDRDEVVLINRGWVPKANIKPESRVQGQVEGEVELIGIYRKAECRAPFMPKNEKQANFWLWSDVKGMAEKMNVKPFMFDLTAESTVPGGPVGGQTRVHLRNEHFSYIVTWYSLSLITSFLWYRRYIKRIPLM